MSSTTITISNVRLTLDELISSIRMFDQETRAQVLDALIADEVDTRLGALIQRLANKQPSEDILDADIDAEIQAVRRSPL